MELLTPELRKSLPPLYSQETNEDQDIRFFGVRYRHGRGMGLTSSALSTPLTTQSEASRPATDSAPPGGLRRAASDTAPSGSREHAVDITADSLFEAAAFGFDALAGAELAEARPGPPTVLEITAHPPAVKHRVSVAQLRKWIDGAGKSPREMLIKQRLKDRFAL